MTSASSIRPRHSSPGSRMDRFSALPHATCRSNACTARQACRSSSRHAGAQGMQVFNTGKPAVTNLHMGRTAEALDFTIDVPVVRDGTTVIDLFLKMSPANVVDLLQRQYIPLGRIATVTDASGQVVARLPNVPRFLGMPIVPALWAAARTHPEGIVSAPTLEGAPAIVAYTHIAPFDWLVAIGAPESVVFAPARAAIIRIGVTGGIVLIAG